MEKKVSACEDRRISFLFSISFLDFQIQDESVKDDQQNTKQCEYIQNIHTMDNPC